MDDLINMSERRVILLGTMGCDAVIICESVKSLRLEEERPLTVERRSKPLQSLGITLGSSSVKKCSRCQSEFSHKGAYCSKECFNASNKK